MEGSTYESGLRVCFTDQGILFVLKIQIKGSEIPAFFTEYSRTVRKFQSFCNSSQAVTEVSKSHSYENLKLTSQEK